MVLTRTQLIEKLNQRLSGAETDEPKEIGADEIDEIESPDAYPIDYAPLLASLNKVFGKDSFVRPEKENDEVLCVYFDPEAYADHAADFQIEKMQDWCFAKGFTIVSRMRDDNATKVYFTPVRLLDEPEKGSPGEKFSTTNFGKAPSK